MHCFIKDLQPLIEEYCELPWNRNEFIEHINIRVLSVPWWTNWRTDVDFLMYATTDYLQSKSTPRYLNLPPIDYERWCAANKELNKDVILFKEREDLNNLEWSKIRLTALLPLIERIVDIVCDPKWY